MAVVDLVIRKGTIADGTSAPLFEGDVAVQDGRIVAIGDVKDRGREEVDARGLLVTPGFVDIHTHYDGQLTWSDRLDPSSGHGVTTVVVGNCGVGFAPCTEADRENLIRMMEGVEDIPELVMSEGLPWDWNSFPDYLSSIERRPHDIDFAVLLPHAPLRLNVMGKRALDLEPATPADLGAMRKLAREAMEAGAIGFSTSRNIFHKASDGSYLPTFTAEDEELVEIAMGLKDAGRGVVQAIAINDSQTPNDYDFIRDAARRSGRPTSFPLTLRDRDGRMWRDILDIVKRDNEAGVDIGVQVLNRPVGVIMGLDTTFHPFSMHPWYQENLAHLSLSDKLAAMRRPQVRAILIQPSDGTLKHPFAHTLRRFDKMYELGSAPDYEPDPAQCIEAIAQRQGRSADELAYDLLLGDEGQAKVMVAAANFPDAKLDDVLELMRHPHSVLGLGDGGAHCGLVSDASYSTFTLTHWARDRKRGDRLELTEAVRMLTSEPARLHRFRDRGRIAVGMKADLNVIDMDRLKLHAPRIEMDLPAGGKRLLQEADGYVATYVSGIAINREGKDMGARPGRLVRDAGI